MKRLTKTSRVSRGKRRDDGSVLTLVLVMMVIGSLVVLPVLKYAVSVSRHNNALTQKTTRLEAVKAGLRVSLSDPVALYQHCGNSQNLASVTVSGITVTNTCRFVDFEVAQGADELRYGITATQLGKSAPSDLSGKFYVPATPTAVNTWQGETTTVSTTDKIWLPNLPVHALNLRSAGGHEMPDGFPECTVYFPGTFQDPVTISGPTYFTSGIYYFENTVTIEGGANVVVGLGATTGCSTDQESAFYAENVPVTHNINGLGGTWIFGGEGRLVVDNSNNTPLSLQFNTRYVASGDTAAAPSADVSIMSVNGDLDVDGVTGIALNEPDVIDVPLSLVGSDAPVPATSQEYLPSVFTPKPEVPDTPAAPTTTRKNGAMVVSWTAPYDGGAPILEYVVNASTGQSCVTYGATSCGITGLTNGQSVTFTVSARNRVGWSQASDSSNSTSASSGQPSLSVPAAAAAPVATAYRQAARITWTAPSNTGGAPITSYTVTASPGGQQCVLETMAATTPALQCDITGLDPLTLPGYTFTVTATNVVGNSTPSSASNLIIPLLALAELPATPPPTADPEFVPTPIVEINLPTAASATVVIPGYISVPQGRVLVRNSNSLSVTVKGGILAAQFDVIDARAAGPNSVPLGFIESVVQRKFQITSTTNQGIERSVAVVQINQNGAYAVNSWEVQ